MLDAIVLAESPLANVRIAGVSARERARRACTLAGATRVIVVDDPARRAELIAWRADRTCPVLVVRADQLVHTPLVAPLAQHPPAQGIAIAVGPTDAYAGALVAAGPATAVIERLAAGASDDELAAGAIARVPHGAVARHAIATPAERRGAHELLYGLLVKPQDNAITRYLYRPVSSRLTRLLVWTPITPNQTSYVTAVLAAIGCWLTTFASMDRVIWGAAIIVAAAYIDCCDGEIARVKLMSSRFGAWVDTLVDELSSLGYMLAIGWHCRTVYGPGVFGVDGFDPWLVAIATGFVTYAWTMYGVYYNIIVAVGSANSQDYCGRFDVVAGAAPGAVRLVPAAAAAIAPRKPLPPVLAFLATYAPYVVRRDFIVWGALLLALLHLDYVAFALLWLGGVVSAAILTTDHVRLRLLRRSLVRAGKTIERPR